MGVYECKSIHVHVGICVYVGESLKGPSHVASTATGAPPPSNAPPGAFTKSSVCQRNREERRGGGMVVSKIRMRY